MRPMQQIVAIIGMIGVWVTALIAANQAPMLPPPPVAVAQQPQQPPSSTQVTTQIPPPPTVMTIQQAGTSPTSSAIPATPLDPAVASAPSSSESTTLSDEEIGSQGNWVKKRKWLEQASSLFTEMHKDIISIQQSRTKFQEKFATVQTEIKDFYQKTGFEEGSVEKVFQDLNTYLEKKKKQDIQALEKADDDEKQIDYRDYLVEEIEDKAQALQIQVDQVLFDFKSIQELNDSLNERLKVLNQSIDSAVQDLSSAERIKNEMWYIIDDQKARDHFYQLKGVTEKSKSILSYVQSTLSSDFDMVIQKIKEQISKLNTNVDQLETKGLFLKNRAAKIEELKAKKREVEKEAEKEAATQKALRTSKKQHQTEVAWYMQPWVLLQELITKGVDLIWSPISSWMNPTPSIKRTKKQVN